MKQKALPVDSRWSSGRILYSIPRSIVSLLFLCFFPLSLYAHHGVASLGVAGLLGPGAPVESSTSANLPRGKVLGYFKLDHANFATYSPERGAEASTSSFFMAGGGYGFTSWLSAYLFVPYNVKQAEDNSYNTAGTADVSIIGVVGFARDGDGFHLIPPSESLDDMEDWHFTVYGGGTIPTGDDAVKDSSGEIDPGMSTGFGSPSYSLGFTATKMLGKVTWINDISYISFDPHDYPDGVRVRFGSEFRYNLAFTYRAYVSEETGVRIDPVFEFNFVRIGSDRERGIANREFRDATAQMMGIPLPAQTYATPFPDSLPYWEWENRQRAIDASSAVPDVNPWDLYYASQGVALAPSGGDILYLLPGFRFYKGNMSLAMGARVPVWTKMNRISPSNLLLSAYLRGSWTGQEFEEIRSTWWENSVLAHRLFQGSEGRERYRLQFSVSFLM